MSSIWNRLCDKPVEVLRNTEGIEEKDGFLMQGDVLIRCALDRLTTTEIRIPEGTKRIMESAFVEPINGRSSWFENVENIIFPDSLEYIGEDAFSHMKKLGKVCLPPRMKELDRYAFFECDCDELIIPGSVKKIEWLGFSKRLKKVTIGEGLKEIVGCFGHTSIEEIILPKSVTKIGAGTFDFCEKLKKVVILSPTCKIDKNAFFPVWVKKEDIKKLSVQIVCSPDVMAKAPKELKHLCVVDIGENESSSSRINLYEQFHTFDAKAYIHSVDSNLDTFNPNYPKSKKVKLNINRVDIEVNCKWKSFEKVRNSLIGESTDEYYGDSPDMFDFLVAKENMLSAEEVANMIDEMDPQRHSDEYAYAKPQLQENTPKMEASVGISRFAFLMAIAKKLEKEDVLLSIAKEMPKKKDGSFAKNKILRIACAGFICAPYFPDDGLILPQIYAKADSENAFTILAANRAATPEELDMFGYDFVSTHPKLFDIEKYITA